MVEKKEIDSYEIKKEGGEDVLYINYFGAPFVPDLAEMPEVMERVVDILLENTSVSRIVLVQQKNYNYDFKETSYLLEIASLYAYLSKQEKILSKGRLSFGDDSFFPKRYNEMFYFLWLLKRDPFFAYS
ncbi:MAG: hypothetical protein QXU40_02975, partial [Candidatus Pacearchaeota archaeon]